MPRRRQPGARRRNMQRRGPRRRRDRQQQTAVATVERPDGPIELPALVTVGDLSDILKISHVDAVKAVLRLGIMATVNEEIDFQTAAQVANAFDVQVRRPRETEESEASRRAAQDEAEAKQDENAVARPPIVTILGHVDHGKTTLLDAIRGTKVVEGEAGGITQSIGAYQATYNDQLITFIDTPGHAAFTAMRARGAQATDIAILLVAVNDGVLPQTIEAIDHAKAAGVPIIVALNKIDLPGADIERTKGQLAEHDIIVESYGGDVVSVEVSALQKLGIDDLLDSILLVGEVEGFSANPDKPAAGVTIESHIDPKRGPMATIIVRSGSVRVGDNVVVGTTRGRIRNMTNGFGEEVKEAGPSTPIQIMGLSELPEPGDSFDVVENEKTARQLVTTRKRIGSGRDKSRRPSTMAEVMRARAGGEIKDLNLVIKTGSQGAIDAVRRALEPLSNDDVQISIVSIGTGVINETDVMLAAASGAIVFGFETFAQPGAVRQADAQGVEIRTYDIIYQLIDDVDGTVKGLITPEEREVILGRAIVQQVFAVGRRDKAGGIRVTDGFFSRSASIRVLRNSEEVYSGRIASLRRFKEDVRDVQTGFEGGVTLQGFNDFEVDDILECFEIQEFQR
ncbi:MAG: translation initiation factor IF-2 [Chloroflexi bacterium]|nr:translation initiation factor IF-2 [Chloroflexota bacterium]